MAAYNKKGDKGLEWSKFEQRGRPDYAIESGIEPAIRQFIRESNSNGEQVNIEIILQFLRDDFNYNIAHTTLWRALQRWGFEFECASVAAQQRLLCSSIKGCNSINF